MCTNSIKSEKKRYQRGNILICCNEYPSQYNPDTGMCLLQINSTETRQQTLVCNDKFVNRLNSSTLAPWCRTLQTYTTYGPCIQLQYCKLITCALQRCLAEGLAPVALPDHVVCFLDIVVAPLLGLHYQRILGWYSIQICVKKVNIGV